MIYYLDTNIIIYALKNSFPAILENFKKVPMQSIAIPMTVLAEIEYGARKSHDYEKTINLYNRFTSKFEKVQFSEKAAGKYGEIRSDLEKEGLPIGGNDLMIAATVMAEGGTLVTHNTKEFSRIKGLKVVDWTE